MRRKAEQGFVTGGVVFGYENRRLDKGKTIRVVYEPEAEVVREIFERRRQEKASERSRRR